MHLLRPLDADSRSRPNPAPTGKPPQGGGVVTYPPTMAEFCLPRLADDYYLIAHNDRTGRARLADPVVSVGLAAALIGELVLSGHLTVTENDVTPTHQDLPAEALAAEILRLVAQRPQERELDTWIAFLAAEAAQDVAERLARDGQLTRTRRRRFAGLGGVCVEYLPVDLSAAAWPTIRLGNLLAGGGEVSLADVVLAGLVDATGLLKHVLWDSVVHAPGYTNTELLLPQLPAPFAALLSRTRIAVADVVLTKRG